MKIKHDKESERKREEESGRETNIRKIKKVRGRERKRVVENGRERKGEEDRGK